MNPLSIIKTLGIVGAGQMGCGIAQIAAQASSTSKIILLDSTKPQIQKAMQFITLLLDKEIVKGKITDQEKLSIISKIHTTDSLKDFSDVDFVIEAISENPLHKKELFQMLDKVVPERCILSSNTSSISITKIGSATKRPSKVIGMHFMNPVPVMKLVEVIPGLATSPETLATTLSFAAALGKTTTVSTDMPGFIANRILMPYINEAVYVLQEGIATREHIDLTMKLGTNVPMGPLTLGDFIGLDTCLAIMKVLHAQLGDDKYRPSPLLVKYVDAGWLGKKSGKGFFDYPKKK